MGKYRGPVCKLCRREGEKLFLKGARCFTPKCSFDRRGYPPGQHGRSSQFRRRRESDYARQLRAKQKARRTYGVMERQFRRYFHRANVTRRVLFRFHHRNAAANGVFYIFDGFLDAAALRVAARYRWAMHDKAKILSLFNDYPVYHRFLLISALSVLIFLFADYPTINYKIQFRE